MRHYKLKEKPSVADQLKNRFKLECLKCGSDDVALSYTGEGGYSEYTQWGSSVTIGCNHCSQNDLYLDSTD